MSPKSQALIVASKDEQIRVATIVTAMILQLGDQLKRGRITEDELIAAFVASEQLGHDEAAVRMAAFIKAYRVLQAPDGEHVEPLLDEFDTGASYGRAVGTVQDLRELDRTQADYDAEFARIIAHAAVTAFRHTLGAGRDTMVWSAAANGTRWRRVTGSKPCSFCVMLATRSDYRTKESAMRVVGRARGYGTASYKATGRVSYGGTMARGARKGQDRRRGTRAIGETYHDHCTCTVCEVVGDEDLTEQELAQRELYERAAEQCDADGVPRSLKNVMQRMRQLDDGSVVHDAHKPETATGGAGGGSKPPPVWPPHPALGEPPGDGDKKAWLNYWKARQDLLEGPNFTASGDALEPDEVLFAERMVALNERLAWIPKGSDGGDRLGPFPTNDFIWLSHNKLKVEQKALLPETPADAVHIARQIAKATGKNKRRHTVDFVVVDIGERELADDARSKLEAYNLVAVRPVRGLWIMAQGQLHHIVLRS